MEVAPLLSLSPNCCSPDSWCLCQVGKISPLTNYVSYPLVSPWWLYQIVTQNTMRTREGKPVLSENIFTFVTASDLNKCLWQIKLPVSLTKYAATSWLPSNKNAMAKSNWSNQSSWNWRHFGYHIFYWMAKKYWQFCKETGDLYFLFNIWKVSLYLSLSICLSYFFFLSFSLTHSLN